MLESIKTMWARPPEADPLSRLAGKTAGIVADLGDLTKWAECGLLLFAAAQRAGMTPEELYDTSDMEGEDLPFLLSLLGHSALQESEKPTLKGIKSLFRFFAFVAGLADVDPCELLAAMEAATQEDAKETS